MILWFYDYIFGGLSKKKKGRTSLDQIENYLQIVKRTIYVNYDRSVVKTQYYKLHIHNTLT